MALGNDFLKMMRTLVYITFLAVAAVLCSCGGKATGDLRADRPDTIVVAAGPDSMLAVVGKASDAGRLQLLLKFQNEFPDTITVDFPDALKPKTDAAKDGAAPLTAGKVVVATVSREESGEFVLHRITDVTDAYIKGCERYLGSWLTPDSAAMELTMLQGGKVAVKNAPKWGYSEWKPLGFDFKSVLLIKAGAPVPDTATVADGKLMLHAVQGKRVSVAALHRSAKK